MSELRVARPSALVFVTLRSGRRLRLCSTPPPELEPTFWEDHVVRCVVLDRLRSDPQLAGVDDAEIAAIHWNAWGRHWQLQQARPGAWTGDSIALVPTIEPLDAA